MMAFTVCILIWMLQISGCITVDVDDCGFSLCGRRFINMMADGFYTTASHIPEQSSLALRGTFKPNTRDTVEWFAGIPSDSEDCKLYSIAFGVKCSQEVIINVKKFDEDDFETVTSVVPEDETIWETFAEIKLPNNVEIVRLDLLPPETRRKKAMLKAVRVVVCCQTGEFCDEMLVMQEATGFFYSSSLPPEVVVELIDGVWAPGVNDIISLNAGVMNNDLCVLYTVVFEYQNASKVLVRERLPDSGLLRTLRVLRPPKGTDADVWISSGILKHSQNIRELQLQLFPIDKESSTPALKDLYMVFCCQSAPPPCTIVQLNDESDELEITTTANEDLATDAFFGTDTCWSTGTTNIEYWDASLPDDSLCSIYSVQYEVANTYELYVEIKRFSDNMAIGLQELEHPDDNPGGVDWWRSGIIVFNQGPNFRNIQSVSLEIWAGQNITELVIPKMRNVKVILCCEPTFSLPLGP